MDQENTKITYSDRLERLIADEGERTQGYSWLHTRSSNHYQKYNTYLALPIIVLSTLSGAISASSSALFQDPKAISLCVGALSIFVGVLSTIQSYFGYAKRAENHRLSGITYSKLNHFLAIEMTLPRKERIAANDLLKIVREQTGRLLEIAPPVPSHIIKEFQERFVSKYPHIAIPDIANGLRAIETAPVESPIQKSKSMFAKNSEETPAPLINVLVEQPT